MTSIIFRGDYPNLQPNIIIESHNSFFEENSIVTLRAKILDTDINDVNYTWEQISGPEIVLGNTSSNYLEFKLPEVESDMEVEFKLTVSNKDFTVIKSTNFTISNLEKTTKVESNSSGSLALIQILMFILLNRIVLFKRKQ